MDVGRRAAFFDIDGTLLAVHSAPFYARYMRKHGRARWRDLLRTAYYLLQYRLNLLDMERALERASELIAGQAEDEIAAFSKQWYEDDMRRHLVPAVCGLLSQHQERGDTVAFLSTTTNYLADPIAEDLGVEHRLVTKLEVENGRFTGRADGPICYGRGKVYWAERFADDHGVDLAQSYFYTDSVTDIPVLERVGHPRIVQPDRLLRREALRRGWPVVPTNDPNVTV